MSTNVRDTAGINRHKPPVKLRHRFLVRVGSSPYSSYCPACRDGVLAMRRDEKTFCLLNTDACLLCGQQVIYRDILDNSHHALQYLPEL